jgi:RNA-directed DNA polymerase
MDGRGKSDDLVVPAKPSNNAAVVVAEMVEGRGSAEGNAVSETQPGLRAGLRASHELDRVRQVARKDKDAQFTALLHPVTVDRLRAAYRAISSSAAAGVDGVTWMEGLRSRSRGQPCRSARSCPPGGISSKAVSQGVHP